MQIPGSGTGFSNDYYRFCRYVLPSILIEGVQNDITRFVIGALSISQLIYSVRSRWRHTWFQDSCKHRQIVYDFLD